MSRTIAFLDSCVLYPFSVRDILMEFAVRGLFQAKWSSQVRQQVIRNIEEKNPATKGKLNRTFDLMEKAIPDFEAEPSKDSIESVANSKTHSEDQEILAAAISGDCTHLVTANLKDFDIGFASANGVAIVHPDVFLSSLILHDSDTAKAALDAVIRRWTNQPVTRDQYLEALRTNRLQKTAEALSGI